MKTRGYAYVEVLIAAGLIAVALVPASDALRSASTYAFEQHALNEADLAAAAGLFTTLAEPFSVLEDEAAATGGVTESSFSEPAGTDHRLVIFVAPHDADDADGDGDPLTGTDAGIVRVTARIEGTAIAYQSLVGEHG